MCLLDVYLVENNKRQFICKSVTHVVYEDNVLVITDLLGRQVKLEGFIQELNTVDNEITVSQCNTLGSPCPG